MKYGTVKKKVGMSDEIRNRAFKNVRYREPGIKKKWECRMKSGTGLLKM